MFRVSEIRLVLCITICVSWASGIWVEAQEADYGKVSVISSTSQP